MSKMPRQVGVGFTESIVPKISIFFGPATSFSTVLELLFAGTLGSPLALAQGP